MTIAAIALAVIAVAALGAAIRDMVVGAGSPRRGWLLRAVAVLAFVAAVIIAAARS